MILFLNSDSRNTYTLYTLIIVRTKLLNEPYPIFLQNGSSKECERTEKIIEFLDKMVCLFNVAWATYN